ncbi:hypothetical protein ACS0TY_027622 [Phlomoides rotata]
MAYYGIASNLVIYLTTKLHEGTVTSANNVTNWIGTVWMTPLIGAYVADTYLGRYWTFIISSSIYLMVYIYTLITLYLMDRVYVNKVHSKKSVYMISA